jgi:alpha-mannosidase
MEVNMRKIHLLCNAHIDPVWLWQWKEGAAEAVSTFRVAADFCEKYDGFIFNHNEALLYEWIENYEPELFKRIQQLVKQGKWVIMGGWYLQPDCIMPSGESLINQICLGREYFKEKFDVVPTTAINFDPFGHTRGLVQILKKTGYDGYIFMRPNEFKGDFWWEGFDGSKILAHGIFGGYNTLKGKALEKLKEMITTENSEYGLCLWGIGNHGGGPSEVDLEQINAFIKESKEIRIIHSDASSYIKEVKSASLPIIKESLIPCMVGCYTSMVRIKQANRRLENKIAVTEKIMSYASIAGKCEFDKNELNKAKRSLAFCQFHDILPGSAIKAVEEDSLRRFAHGEEIADQLFAKAFFALCEGQKKAKGKEIPIMVWNPHPFEMEGEFEIEFMLEDQNWQLGERTIAQVYDEGGNALPSQNEKPECTFNLDWIQKVSFKAKLEPSSVNRFDCKLTVINDSKIEKCDEMDNCFVCKNEFMTVMIDKKTGLISRYEVNGKLLVSHSGKLEIYYDNEDPWGMTVDSFKDKAGEFTLMSDADANAFIGYPEENEENVRIVENGEVRIKIQAIFEYGRSVAIVEYTIPKKNKYIDVNIMLYSNETNKMVKYRLDTTIENGIPYGQTAFGCEELFRDGRESVFHKWCALKGANEMLGIVNDGIYGGSFKESIITLSLLRTPLYSAHPINDRQIAPHNRFIKHVDMGERVFNFRITPEKNIEREALIYNEKPYALSFFPPGTGEKRGEILLIDNPFVIMTAIKKYRNGYIAHLFNSTVGSCQAEVSVLPFKQKKSFCFNKYELKFIQIQGDEIIEVEGSEITYNG